MRTVLIWTVSLWILLPTGALTENNTLAIDVATARQRYGELFRVERVDDPSGGAPRISIELAELPVDHPLTELASREQHLLYYLLTLAEIPDDRRDAALADPAFPRAYVALFAEQRAFDEVALEIVDRHLRARGGGIRGHRPADPRSFTEEALLRSAVRYFYPDMLFPDGGIGTHICGALNGLGDLEQRDPYAEALAYSAIVRETYRDDSPLMARLSEATSLAKSLQLGPDRSILLARAQGLVWGQLVQSEELRATLRQEYQRIGHLLPLAIEWDE